MIIDKCTNKNCTFKVDSLPTKATKKTSPRNKGTSNDKDSSTPGSNKRRNSKCVTYKLDDFLEKKESENEEK
jgi:hypothetical protein